MPATAARCALLRIWSRRADSPATRRLVASSPSGTRIVTSWASSYRWPRRWCEPKSQSICGDEYVCEQAGEMEVWVGVLGTAVLGEMSLMIYLTNSSFTRRGGAWSNMWNYTSRLIQLRFINSP